jgi:hypothetical protein
MLLLEVGYEDAHDNGPGWQGFKFHVQILWISRPHGKAKPVVIRSRAAVYGETDGLEAPLAAQGTTVSLGTIHARHHEFSEREYGRHPRQRKPNFDVPSHVSSLQVAARLWRGCKHPEQTRTAATMRGLIYEPRGYHIPIYPRVA